MLGDKRLPRVPERRRYVVKSVTSWPGWTGTLRCIGCKHLTSAEVLFDRQAEEWEADPSTALLLIDREDRKVLRSVGSSDPDKTASYFGWWAAHDAGRWLLDRPSCIRSVEGSGSVPKPTAVGVWQTDEEPTRQSTHTSRS